MGRDLIHDAVIAARDVQHAFAIERQTRGIHQIRHERLGIVVRVDFVNGDRRFLTTRAAERAEHIPFPIDCGARDRMQAVSDLDTEMSFAKLAFERAACNYYFPDHSGFRHAGDDV